MDQYAVMGNPIAHSLSPAIHRAFAEQTGQQLEYRALLVEPGSFASRVQEFFAQGGLGLNVTVPFKQEAWELASQRSPEAETAGAVNTLLQDSSGKLQGHNTDGIGLVRDITSNFGLGLKGKDLVILGAGGATRGILLPILREFPASVLIANRTRAKAETLVELFREYGEVRATGLDELEGVQTDWLINATSASLQGELPALPDSILRAGATCYDLMYAKQATAFCRWAERHGAAQVMDGLGMLVEQAAESFFLWRGLRPATQAVLAGLR